ncbi:hypothetical protein Ptc2401_01334 [Prosthecochloris sp. CIB 2401]|nr:hypothetical protein Ptc2401_01334 [Prosthecochloris sp. CIB 2401]
MLDELAALVDALGQEEPAEAQAGAEDFGEGAGVADVEAAGVGGFDGGEAGFVFFVEVEVAVGVVFDEDDVGACEGAGDLLFAFGGVEDAAGVVEVGGEVEEFCFVWALGFFFELVDVYAFVVEVDAGELGLVGVEGRDGADEAGVFDEYAVAGVDEGAGEEGDGLLGAGGDHEAVGADREAFAFEVLAE